MISTNKKSLFQRRHYEAIAAVLHRVSDTSEIAPWEVMKVAERLADRFLDDNPNFNPARFYDAVKKGKT